MSQASEWTSKLRVEEDVKEIVRDDEFARGLGDEYVSLSVQLTYEPDMRLAKKRSLEL